jgi:hypothetical protein
MAGSAIMQSDIEYGEFEIDPQALSEVFHKSASSVAQNYGIAYTLADNILEDQEQNIEESLSDYIHGMGTLPGLAAAYKKDDFCGATNEEFISEVLSKIVLYTLRLDLEARIFYGLEAGMDYDEVESDINANLGDDMELIIKYAIWDLQDTCKSHANDGSVYMFMPEGPDFYTLLYNYLFIAPFDSDKDGILDSSEVPDAEVDTNPRDATDAGGMTCVIHESVQGTDTGMFGGVWKGEVPEELKDKMVCTYKKPKVDEFNPYVDLWLISRPSSADITGLILPVGSLLKYNPTYENMPFRGKFRYPAGEKWINKGWEQSVYGNAGIDIEEMSEIINSEMVMTADEMVEIIKPTIISEFELLEANTFAYIDYAAALSEDLTAMILEDALDAMVEEAAVEEAGIVAI